MERLNFFLKTINGSVSILSFFLLFFLASYLISDIKREGFTFKAFFCISTAMSLVVALFIEKTGTLATRTIIWAWRTQGGNLPFNGIQNLFLALGAVITAIGLVMMIRILSRPRFGNWPWLVSAFVAVDYVVAETFIRVMG